MNEYFVRVVFNTGAVHEVRYTGEETFIAALTAVQEDIAPVVTDDMYPVDIFIRQESA